MLGSAPLFGVYDWSASILRFWLLVILAAQVLFALTTFVYSSIVFLTHAFATWRNR